MQTLTPVGGELSHLREKCRRLDDQLRQLQKIEAVGHLTSGIAHDFGNLLTVILGSGEMLRESLEPADHRREYAEEIMQAADRARGLTARLLAFSRRDDPDPEVLDLNGLIRGMQNILERTIGEDIAIAFDLDDHIDPVRAHKGQLEQVLMNLVVNARDAMPHGGRLTVATRRERLTRPRSHHGVSVGPGVYSVFTVTDTGCGIASDVEPKLFEPLFTTKACGQGTGMGLFTCDGIVRASGGLIAIDGAARGGTIFSVLLPACAGEGRTPLPQESAAATPCAGETILLVEDSAETRSVVRRMLERSGYGVIEAASGSEALLLTETIGRPVHLIVCDVVVPDVPGPEIARRFRSEFPMTRVLFMSGHTTHALLRDGRLQTGTNFIQKPFDRNAFLQKVREVLHG